MRLIRDISRAFGRRAQGYAHDHHRHRTIDQGIGNTAEGPEPPA